MQEGNGDGGKGRLSAPVMAALDAGRGLAALYVVVHHVVQRYGGPFPLRLAFRFGPEAVMLFFLLSGFVIFANERDRAHDLRAYFGRRLRRIYPTLLIALIVSTLVALDDGRLSREFSLAQLLGTLANVQDISALMPGVIVDPYLANNPLWSLSYEMAFYLAFPFVLRAWRAWPARMPHLIGASCCLAYIAFAWWPNHWALVAAYFLVWWTGAMVAQAWLAGERSPWALRGNIAWLAALCVTAGAVVALAGYRGAGYYPMLSLRQFVAGLVLVVALFGPLGRALSRMAMGGRGAAAALASISYGLYVLHYPLLVQWHRAGSMGGMVLAIALLLALAWIADRRLARLISARKPV